MAIDKIISASITDGTIATADIADGAVTSVKTTGVGGVNTPAFEAKLSSSQAIANQTYVKVQFSDEVFDSDGTYDNSTNYRFTPGVVGKYYMFAQVCLDDLNDGSFFDIYLKKNGSNYRAVSRLYSGHTNKQSSILVYIENVTSTSDYYEIDVYQNTGVSRNLRTDIGSYFGAYKIIE
tara:strand:+ start:508 stop:1041 length:534 start_codon:yes stop_codon:yes gene_type:complete